MGCTNNDIDTCGCLHEHSSKCIIYQGERLSCIDAVSGDNLEEIFVNINSAICALSPSSFPVVEVSQGNGVTVTETVVNGTTIYTVALSAATITTLTNFGISIAAINACLTNTVRDVVSDTLSVTLESSNGCGRVLRVESISPSSIPLQAGVIYNSTDPISTTGGGGIQTLKSFNTDYTQYNLTTGDVIEFTLTGQLIDNSGVVDDVIIELFDATSATVLFTQTIGAWNNDGKSSFNTHGVLDVTGVNTGLLGLAFEYHSLENGVLNSTRRGRTINKDVSGIDYTNLTINLKYNNTSGASADNFGRQLKVEVKKLI